MTKKDQGRGTQVKNATATKKPTLPESVFPSLPKVPRKETSR